MSKPAPTVGVLVAALVLQSCNIFDSNLVRVCEQALRERLKSPTSYTRISLKEFSAELSADEYRSRQNGKTNDSLIELRVQQINEGDPYFVHKILLEFDVMNGFGAIIRNRAICEYGGDPSRAEKWSVLVDGKTEHDWAMDRLREQAR